MAWDGLSWGTGTQTSSRLSPAGMSSTVMSSITIGKSATTSFALPADAASVASHSERRHRFGETDADTERKLSAVLEAQLLPLLCVGETLAEREAGNTLDVVTRQLEAALGRRPPAALQQVTVAYEPVWAIGTGRNATPRDAAEVHRAIRRWLAEHGAKSSRILYGGSVSLKNAAALLAERELDGVLVGGASLDPATWGELVRTATA